MAGIVNLNKARKAKAKLAGAAQAAENRVKFGRTKAQKGADKAQADKAEQALDRARRDKD